jgi:hypothetical protein
MSTLKGSNIYTHIDIHIHIHMHIHIDIPALKRSRKTPAEKSSSAGGTTCKGIKRQ